MKKVLIIAAMMVATVSAKAQFEPGTFSLQPRLGGVVAWLSDMPKIDLGYNVTLDKTLTAGFVIGGEAEYQVTNMLSIAAGLNYSLQGSAWEDYEEKMGDYRFELKDARVQLGYLTLPVVANLYLFKGFAVKAGVQFGYLTNANLKATSTSKFGSTMTTDTDVSCYDDCEKLDISIPMGVSYQFKAPVVIDMRYNLGLTKVFKTDASDGRKCKNNVVQLTVGYKFAL